jgi:predicted transcriptional regulator of viral defense system
MKYQELKKALKVPYFNKMDLNQRNLKVYPYQFNLWTKKGAIGKLKRGMHFFIENIMDIESEEIAFFIYNPSYISLEYALSHYGLIPEAVFSITSVTTLANRSFKNQFGNFLYKHLKPELFFGYKSVNTRFGKYLLAEPEKAVLDYFYLNLGKIDNNEDIEELRINEEIFNEIIDKKKLEKYLKIFNIKKLNKTINLLIEICSR